MSLARLMAWLCGLAIAWSLDSQSAIAEASNNASDAALFSRVQSERGLLEWHFKGRKLLAYAFATNQFKPGAVPARWGAVSHAKDGRTIQVALFASPRSQAGARSIFAMTDPFTYLSATQGLDKASLEYRAGDRFAIDHLVLVYSTTRTVAQLQTRYQSWASKLKPNER